MQIAIKTYHCQVCQSKFSKPSTLKTHMYSHTGEKPFICDHPQCSSKFSVLSNLRRHMKIHKKDYVSTPTKRISAKERLYHVQQLIIRSQQL